MRRGAGRDAKHALELGTGDAKIAGFAGRPQTLGEPVPLISN